MPFGVMLKRDFPSERRIRKKKARTTAGKANKALSLAHKIMRGIETKYLLRTVYTTAVTQAGTITHVSDIAQGDDASSRTGNKVTLKNLRVRMSFLSAPAANLNAGCLIRVIFVQDMQQVQDTDLMLATVLSSASVTSNYNFPGLIGRFSILYDRVYDLNAPGGFGATGAAFNLVSKQIHRSIVVRPKVNLLRYNGINGSDTQKNNIYMIVMKSSADANQTVTPAIDILLKFTDA